MKTILVFLTACVAISAQTERKGTLQKFGESDLLVVRTQKGFSTLIEFPANQGILEATCGDKEFWVIEGRDRFLNVKPAKEGITTNLNVLVEGDIIYSFLLKEISKPGGTKEAADFRVTVTSVDELKRLRKDKEDLESAVASRERELRDLTSKYEAEVSRATKNESGSGMGPDAVNKTGKVGPEVVPQAITPPRTTTQDTHPATTLEAYQPYDPPKTTQAVTTITAARAAPTVASWRPARPQTAGFRPTRQQTAGIRSTYQHTGGFQPDRWARTYGVPAKQ